MRGTTVIRRASSAVWGCALLRPLIAVLPLLAACGSSPSGGDAVTKPGWGQPEVLADLAVFDSSVGVSLDGDGQGNAIAVWAPSTQVFAPVLARRYSAREGWRAVETVAPAGSGSVNTPTVQMNARGDAVSIWEDYFGLKASAAASGGSWQSPVLIGTPDFGSWSWGLDDEGRALVVWLWNRSVLTCRLEPGSGWGQATLLPGAGGQASFLQAPTIAVSRSGHAVVVWSRAETPGGDEEFWANSFDPRQGWADPHRLGPQQPSSPVIQATVFINSEGDGLVSWLESHPGPGGGVLQVSRYARPTGFGPAEPLGPSAGAATAAAIDTSGNVLVIYQSGLGLRRQRYVPGSGWQLPEPLDGVGGYDAVPLDDHGNGWVLWNERIDSSVVSIRSRRLAAGVATGPVEEAAAPFTGYAWFGGTPLDVRGGLVAAWFQLVPPLPPQDSPPRYALVANRFHVE